MLETHESTHKRVRPSRPVEEERETFLPDDGTMEGELRAVTGSPPAWRWLGLLVVGAVGVWAYTLFAAEPVFVESPVASVEESLKAFEAALEGELPPEDREVLAMAYADLKEFAARQ